MLRYTGCAGKHRAVEGKQLSDGQTSNRADVLVVGSGIAGLCATVAARQAGASVIQLERSCEADRGGNTRWTEAFMRMKSEHEVADDFESHFAANAGNHLDPSLLREMTGDFASRSAPARVLGCSDPDVITRFASEAGESVGWLKSFGVRFDFLPSYLITTCTTRLAPVGGGLALVEALSEEAARLAVDTRFETTARSLMQDRNGAVVGIEAVTKHNSKIEFKAASVILACGGFEGNPEMLGRYIGSKASQLRPVARGGYFNRGEGIDMALRIGAAPSGDYGLFHAEPLDPRSGVAEPIVLVFNYGILVNRHAQRFIDEAPATVDATYEEITRQVLEQPGGIAWIILDSKIDDVPGWQRAVRSDVAPYKASDIASLAALIDVPAQALIDTLSTYNSNCPSGEGYDPLQTDGLATHPAYLPKKSNWSRPIDRAPFYAYPIMCGNCFTFGGLKVDPNARVLNMDGEVIPGLYAAGETMGIYYGTYTGASSVLRGAVFGRLAGIDAANRASSL